MWESCKTTVQMGYFKLLFQPTKLYYRGISYWSEMPRKDGTRDFIHAATTLDGQITFYLFLSLECFLWRRDVRKLRRHPRKTGYSISMWRIQRRKGWRLIQEKISIAKEFDALKKLNKISTELVSTNAMLNSLVEEKSDMEASRKRIEVKISSFWR